MTTNRHHRHRINGRTPARPPLGISPCPVASAPNASTTAQAKRLQGAMRAKKSGEISPPSNGGEGQGRDFPETIRALNPRTSALLTPPSPPRSRGGPGRGVALPSGSWGRRSVFMRRPPGSHESRQHKLSQGGHLLSRPHPKHTRKHSGHT